MPKKTFVAGEVLTAAEVNTYLMDQAVMTFAGTAARGSAIASPSEGMVSYLDDSNQLEVFDGSNWVGLAGASVGTATPASTAEGDFWLDTNPDGQVLKAYNSGWKNVGPVSNNAIINGDFGIWQRGTSTTSIAAYLADRWRILFSTSATGLTSTYSRQSFSLADIEAIGYGDAEYFARYEVTTIGSATNPGLGQFVEDVRTFANQEVTLSFWAKSSSDTSVSIVAGQGFGSGGSSFVTGISTTETLTSSWQRFSVTFSLPSLSGKTIGSGSSVQVRIGLPSAADGSVLDLWGVQLEAGSVATPFRLAGGGNKAAELALCQRYCQTYPSSNQDAVAMGYANTTTTARFQILYPVTMRAAASLTVVDASQTQWQESGGASGAFSNLALAATGGPNGAALDGTGSGLTQHRPLRVWGISSGGTFPSFILDAEL